MHGYPAPISKLPMRQLTAERCIFAECSISKLPMRQLTGRVHHHIGKRISKLPMRQLTADEETTDTDLCF